MGASILILSLSTIGIPALASDPQDGAPDYARSGLYVGVGAFFAIPDISLTTTELGVVPPQPPGIDPDFGYSGGIDGRFGWRAFRRWAFELDYQWQAGFDSGSPAIDPALEIDTHLLSANAKFFVLTGRWQPYALLGGSLLIFNIEIVDPSFRKPWDVDYGFAPRFGGGIDYYIDERWVLTFEGTYVYAVGVLEGANMASVGVSAQYRF